MNDLKIQKRDKELLQMLHHYGLLESRHIHAKCFHGIVPTTMYRRLRKLEKDGLICRSAGLKNGLAAYYLGSTGATAIGQDVFARFTNRNAYEHELAITDFRMSLEGIGLCRDFVSERRVRKNFLWTRSSRHRDQLIPDGILIEEVNGKPTAVALEVELSPKTAKRYKHIFEEYRFMRSVGYVWYVVSDLSIKRSLLKAWNDVRRFEHSPRLMISELKEIIAKPQAATLHFDDGTTAIIGDFFGPDSEKGDLLTTTEKAAQCVSTLDRENPTESTS